VPIKEKGFQYDLGKQEGRFTMLISVLNTFVEETYYRLHTNYKGKMLFICIYVIYVYTTICCLALLLFLFCKWLLFLPGRSGKNLKSFTKKSG
jgi:hypothetical protein